MGGGASADAKVPSGTDLAAAASKMDEKELGKLITSLDHVTWCQKHLPLPPAVSMEVRHMRSFEGSFLV